MSKKNKKIQENEEKLKKIKGNKKLGMKWERDKQMKERRKETEINENKMSKKKKRD